MTATHVDRSSVDFPPMLAPAQAKQVSRTASRTADEQAACMGLRTSPSDTLNQQAEIADPQVALSHRCCRIWPERPCGAHLSAASPLACRLPAPSHWARHSCCCYCCPAGGAKGPPAAAEGPMQQSLGGCCLLPLLQTVGGKRSSLRAQRLGTPPATQHSAQQVGLRWMHKQEASQSVYAHSFSSDACQATIATAPGKAPQRAAGDSPVQSLPAHPSRLQQPPSS